MERDHHMVTSPATRIEPASPAVSSPTTTTSTPPSSSFSNWSSWLPSLLSRSHSPSTRSSCTAADALTVMRVNQLDAQQLDNELLHLLQYQLRNVFQYFDPSLLTHFKAELDALLSLCLYGCTVLIDQPTPGAKLQNITLTTTQHLQQHKTDNPVATSNIKALITADADTINHPISLLAAADVLCLPPLSSGTKILYVLLGIVFPYLHQRLSAHMTLEAWFGAETDNWRYHVYHLVRRLQLFFQWASLLNFLVFLSQGRYRSLFDRLLSLRFIYLRSRVNRILNFDYMHQQLAFSILSEFTLTVLPLIPFHWGYSLINRISGWIIPSKSFAYSSHTGTQRQQQMQRELQELDASGGCFICRRSVAVMPYLSLPCLHSYCYYCLAAHYLYYSKWHCGYCQQKVEGYEVWSWDREQQRRERQEQGAR